MENDLYSWRLREYIPIAYSGSDDHSAELSRFKGAWDDPSYQELREGSGPSQYCYEGENNTCVFAITGPGTAFDEAATQNWKIVDGETVIIVEVASSQTHWMAPGDFDIRSIPNTINSKEEVGISSRFAGGVHIGFADGEVWFISEMVPYYRTQKLLYD